MPARTTADALVDALHTLNTTGTPTVNAQSSPRRAMLRRGYATTTPDGRTVLTGKGIAHAREIAADHRPDPRADTTRRITEAINAAGLGHCRVTHVGVTAKVRLERYTEEAAREALAAAVLALRGLLFLEDVAGQVRTTGPGVRQPLFYPFITATVTSH